MEQDMDIKTQGGANDVTGHEFNDGYRKIGGQSEAGDP